ALDRGALPDRDDALAADRDRLRPRMGRVGGEDLAVEEQQVGGGGRAAAGGDGERRQGREEAGLHARASPLLALRVLPRARNVSRSISEARCSRNSSAVMDATSRPLRNSIASIARDHSSSRRATSSASRTR